MHYPYVIQQYTYVDATKKHIFPVPIFHNTHPYQTGRTSICSMIPPHEISALRRFNSNIFLSRGIAERVLLLHMNF